MTGATLTPEELFAAPAPRIFTAPPSRDFLLSVARTLAQALDLRSDPAALADAVIFTPNRRAGRVLAEMFHDVAQDMGHGALIAPDIRVLGDLEDDNTISPIGVSELELGPPLSDARRRGALARLVQAWHERKDGAALPPGSALAAADQLSSLLDQAAMGEDVDWARLETAVPDADLAEHWRESADFLKIIADAWPAFLAEEGATDPMARRVAAAESLANLWRDAPPRNPVIVAGSTGATPATRLLMQAALGLPRGAVILPGLDRDMSDAAWAAVERSPSHPQFTLRRALQRLAIDRRAVRPWPDGGESAADAARRKLVNEALAPASTTGDWTKRLAEMAAPGEPGAFVDAALSGLSLVEAEDENEEALAAALLLRETLETPGRTAALVTPDPGLARRVSALLKRWDVDVTPSAGLPFLQSPQGALLSLMFRWLDDPGDPVALLALLKHPMVRLGREDEDKAAALRELETHKDEYGDHPLIRGPRRHKDPDDLAGRLDRRGRPRAAALVSALAAAARDAGASQEPAALLRSAYAACAARLAEILCSASPTDPGHVMWRGRAGAEAARFLETLSELSNELGPLPADLWPEFADAVAADCRIPPSRGEHPRIAIWGPLEARLQMRDLVILGSLNEGSWPAPAAADSFLPRRLRRELGLPDPEERLGLSAHDFAQLACAPRVILLRSKRVEDKPAVASRWIWRLRTLASGGLGGMDRTDETLRLPPGSDPLAWAESLRHVETVLPNAPPEPTPPIHARPRKFSVSRVTRLIRDPYAVYAGDILRLKPLAPVGQAVGPAQRGTAIHDAVERFEKSDGRDDLLSLICARLEEAGTPPADIELMRPLWARAADAYVNWRTAREPIVRRHWEEISGEIPLEIGDAYVLTAKADRIEWLTDDTLAVIDFKTGTPKTKKQVESGLEPQLPLEAAIAMRGGFPGIPALPTSQIIYVSLSPGAASVAPNSGKPLDISPMDEAAKALEGFGRLVAAYADPAQPYRSKPRVEFSWNVSDYDRLARRAEWTSDDGEDAA